MTSINTIRQCSIAACIEEAFGGRFPPTTAGMTNSEATPSGMTGQDIYTACGCKDTLADIGAGIPFIGLFTKKKGGIKIISSDDASRADGAVLKEYRNISTSERELEKTIRTSKEPKTVLKAYDSLLGIYDMMSDNAQLASTHADKGTYLAELGRHKEALAEFNEAKELLTAILINPSHYAYVNAGDIIETYTDTMEGLGKSQMELKQYFNAALTFKTAAEACHQMDMFDDEKAFLALAKEAQNSELMQITKQDQYRPATTRGVATMIYQRMDTVKRIAELLNDLSNNKAKSAVVKYLNRIADDSKSIAEGLPNDTLIQIGKFTRSIRADIQLLAATAYDLLGRLSVEWPRDKTKRDTALAAMIYEGHRIFDKFLKGGLTEKNFKYLPLVSKIIKDTLQFEFEGPLKADEAKIRVQLTKLQNKVRELTTGYSSGGVIRPIGPERPGPSLSELAERSERTAKRVRESRERTEGRGKRRGK